MKRIAWLPLLFVMITLTASATDLQGDEPTPRLEEAIPITQWHVVGPFLSGSREPLANPMGRTIDPETGEVDLTATYPSVQEFGGTVGWQLTTVDDEGSLVFSFDNPDWDKINDEWGVSGISFSAAAYSTFDCPQRCRALVNGDGIGSFSINGKWYSGDPYGHGLIQTPVILDEGENRVFFMTGGYGGSDAVKFEVLPAPQTDLIVLEKDIIVGDVVRGEYGQIHIGVPILNTTDRWIDSVTINDTSRLDDFPPLTVVKAPVWFEIMEDTTDWESDTYDVPVKIEWDGGSYETTAQARVRDPDDSRIVTFASWMDGSVQKYAIRYPINYDPSREYALILTTHGAGVECEGQVDAFAPKDWAFVVAATNRRRFGFDWQDWGRLDAMEVLDRCLMDYPIDPNRVYLIGHSMGGHGAWHIGCTHADRFAAIVPSAGWASFQLYVPWFLRMDEMFRDPHCARIFEQCTSPDRTERLLPNLRNTPVLAVQGGNDDDVPPTHARLLTGILERMGYDVRLWEEPGMGHWWDNTPDIPGADCVDALRIQSFCRERERNPHPRHVTFLSYDLGNNDSMYWVKVDEKISPIGRIFVDAELTRDGTLTCETDNVQSLTFNFGSEFPYSRPTRIQIDGQDVQDIPRATDLVSVLNTDQGWIVKPAGADDSGPEYVRRGPIKRAYFHLFYIIVGQSGTPEQNELNMEIARNLAQRWWYRANGYTQILPDTNVPELVTSQAHNLILIGGPDSNLLSAEYASSFPIIMEQNGVRLGSMWIEGSDLACQFVYPRPDNPYSLIHAIWGNSLEGMRLAGGLTCLYSGSNLPDFLIYDEDVRLMGYAGVRAAGFFDNDWLVDPDFAYVR